MPDLSAYSRQQQNHQTASANGSRKRREGFNIESAMQIDDQAVTILTQPGFCLTGQKCMDAIGRMFAEP
ncbi:hypothetical protein PSSHI_12450 [Photobacterium sp. R1]